MDGDVWEEQTFIWVCGGTSLPRPSPRCAHPRPSWWGGGPACWKPHHSQLSTAEVLTCLQEALIFFSHCPVILSQNSGISMRVPYILPLRKWSHVMWAEARGGRGVLSPSDAGGWGWFGRERRWACWEDRLAVLGAFHDHRVLPVSTSHPGKTTFCLTGSHIMLF